MTTKNSKVPDKLLSREQAREMLGGVSVATLVRLEKSGRLKVRRLLGSPVGKVFYPASQVQALIEEASANIE